MTQKKRGRPKTAKGRDPTFSLRIPAELIAWLREEAGQRGMSRNATVIEILEYERLSPRDLIPDRE